MRIFGKSRLDNNVYDKMQKGADAIEIHLDEDFVRTKEYWNEKIIAEVPIAVVHAPLTNESNTDVEEIASREVLVRVCDFAQKIAVAQHHQVIVVCHLSTSVELLQKLGVYEDLVFFIRDLIEMFPNIEIAIENVTRFNNDKNEYIGFKWASFHDSIRFAKDIAHARVGTCLDTCHAMIDIGLINYITGYLRKTGEMLNDEIIGGIDEFFKQNQHTIKLIHLSNAQSHGLYEDHGLPFTMNDDEKLKAILLLYKKYNYQCPITIEVREIDYSNARYFQITLNSLKRVLDKIMSEK